MKSGENEPKRSFEVISHGKFALESEGTQSVTNFDINTKLRRSTTVDWQIRESVRAQLRIPVHRTLQKYKYPPDKAVEAVELILKQAEILSNEWSGEISKFLTHRTDVCYTTGYFQKKEGIL